MSSIENFVDAHFHGIIMANNGNPLITTNKPVVTTNKPMDQQKVSAQQGPKLLLLKRTCAT